MKRAQIIFQAPYSSLDPRMPIGEIVAEGMDVHCSYTKEERNKKVASLLRSVGLKEEFSNRFAHDLSMVRHISDRVGVMYLGSLVELTESKEIFKNPIHPYTKILMSAIPVADPDAGSSKKRMEIRGEVPSPINAPSGCKFRTRCPYATDLCAPEAPVLREVKPGHFVACHHCQA